MRGLEIGVNDYLMRPIDRNEMLARVRTQVRKKRYTERLRDNVQMSIELAITDGLTGLHNRRYMETPSRHAGRAGGGARQAAPVLVLDIDYFKAINDSYGHDAGDDVLREFSLRVRKASAASISPAATAARNSSSSCRTPTWRWPRWSPSACASGSPSEPFAIRGARTFEVTISIGIAASPATTTTPRALLKRADEALYRAKRDGRNRVVPDAA